MIYVLRSVAFKEEGGFETIIKIGYTGEKSKKNRFSLYLTENPTIQTLFLINGGTERDEKNLHRHFKNYLVYGQEWFRDVDEIIEFFTNHKTKESLKELEQWELNNNQITIASQKKKDNLLKIPQINLSVSIIGKELEINEKEKLEKYLWYSLDDFWNVIDREFSEYKEEIKQGIEKIHIDKRDGELINFITEFYSDNNFERRMKMLCDINKRYPKFFSLYAPYLQFIPLRYQNYINSIGFDKIRALNYKEIEITRYIERLSLGEEVNLDLSGLFSIGSRYSKKQIKEMLGEYYEENNITKTPKASDLEQYFNLKACKVKIDDKWENGFEIVSLKEES